MDYLASEENCNIDYKITRKITILATQRKLEAFTFLTSQVSTVLTILPRRAGSTLLLVRWDSNLTKNDRNKGNVLILIPRFNSAEMVDVNGSLAIRILP